MAAKSEWQAGRQTYRNLNESEWKIYFFLSLQANTVPTCLILIIISLCCYHVRSSNSYILDSFFLWNDPTSSHHPWPRPPACCCAVLDSADPGSPRRTTSPHERFVVDVIQTTDLSSNETSATDAHFGGWGFEDRFFHITFLLMFSLSIVFECRSKSILTSSSKMVVLY